MWPLPQDGTAECQKKPWPMISPTRRSERMWVIAQLPQLCGAPSKRPSSFSPHSGYWSVLQMGSSWENSSQGSWTPPRGTWGSYKGTWILQTVLQTPSWVTGNPPTNPPNWSEGTPNTLQAHPHIPLYGQLLVHVPYGSRYKPLQTARECIQKVSQTLQDWEKAHQFEHSHSPRESKWEAVSIWLCRIMRRHNIVRNHWTWRGKKKRGAGASVEGLKKPGIPNKNGGNSLPKSVSKDWRR